MRLLKSVIFINSAAMPFAKVNLDGNIHLTGKNGSGKTSILRAILFFYNPDTQNLGIGTNQKSFTDFYFPDINSYIIYEVQKEHFTYLVIAFKKQNRVCFRIIESDFQIENFIKDRRVNTIQEVLESFHHDRKPVLNKTIDTYKDFKTLIYGSENDYKRFSIFDSKGLNYQSIPRTITNIFLNYKLDSQFIKHSIINSIIEEPPAINLVKLKHQLNKFDKDYKDIKIFNTHFRSAKNIVDILFKLNEMENQKIEISGMLGYKVTNAKLEQLSLEKQIKALETEIDLLKKELFQIENEHNKSDGEFNFNIKTLENKLKTAEQKKLYYQNINIEKIIEAVNKKSSFEEELEITKKEIDFLTSEHMDVKQKYEMLSREIIQSIKEKENDLNRFKNDLNHNLINDKEEIKSQYEILINELKERYQKSFEIISERIKINTSKFNELIREKSKIEYSTPLKDKIDELILKVENYQKEIHKNEFNRKDLENKLEHYKKDLKYKSEEKVSKIKAHDEKYSNKIKNLETELNHLNEKLKVADSSFSGFLEKNYSGYQNNIAKVVSEDVLFSTVLNPSIIEKNNLLFGLSIDLNSLPPAKTIDAYREKRDVLQVEMLKVKNEYDQISDQLKNNFNNEEDSINKKITELEKSLYKVKKETDNFKIIQESTSSQLKRTKSESDNIKKQELEKIADDILSQKSITENLETEKKSLNSELDKEVKNFNDKKASKINVLNDIFNNELNNHDIELKNFIKINNQKLLEIDNEYKKELLSRGANEPRIKELEEKKKLFVSKIDFANKSLPEYYKYHDDKKEFFDKISDFNEEISRIKKNKELSNKEYLKDKIELNTSINAHSTDHINKTDLFRQLDHELENFEQFKLNSLYSELSPFILDETYFVQTEKKVLSLITDLNNIKTQLMEKLNTLRDKITRYADNFDTDNIFSFNKNINTENYFLNFAQDLKSFIEEDKLKEFQKLLSSNYRLIIDNLKQQIDELTSKEGEIQKTITRINSSFEKTRKIDVIKDIELRLKESNNRIIHFLRKIREFKEQNPFAGEFNLFHQNPDKEDDEKAIELLKNLKQSIEESKSDKISLEESFEIEFRIKENNNDTGFIERLSNIGSNGTDVLVKAMIYITLLDVAKTRLKLKDFRIHCIIDEVGILDNNYLKYLIQFANEKDILLINGSPNPTDKYLYDYFFRVRKDQKSNSIVKHIVEGRLNEVTPEFSQETAGVN